jgi:hypothetical protein
MKAMRGRVTSSPYWYSAGEIKCRLRELILYIAGRCESHEIFGAMKLNKLLFLADFTLYLVHRKSISGSQYQKLPQGPVPMHLFSLRKEMIAADDILVRKEKIFSKTQHRIIPLREPDLDIFTGRDIALLNEIIDELKERSSREKSERPHGLAWELAKVREVIPYETVLLDNRRLQRQDIEEAHRLIREHGWRGV